VVENFPGTHTDAKKYGLYKNTILSVCVCVGTLLACGVVKNELFSWLMCMGIPAGQVLENELYSLPVCGNAFGDACSGMLCGAK
jgi:hypothetical protein